MKPGTGSELWRLVVSGSMGAAYSELDPQRLALAKAALFDEFLKGLGEADEPTKQAVLTLIQRAGQRLKPRV
jgi:hypothetical protein